MYSIYYCCDDVDVHRYRKKPCAPLHLAMETCQSIAHICTSFLYGSIVCRRWKKGGLLFTADSRWDRNQHVLDNWWANNYMQRRGKFFFFYVLTVIALHFTLPKKQERSELLRIINRLRMFMGGENFIYGEMCQCQKERKDKEKN